MSEATVSDSTEDAMPSPRAARFSWSAPLLAALALALYAAAAGLYVRSTRRPFSVSGLRVAGREIGALEFGALEARIREAAEPSLDEPILLLVGDEKIRARRREVGFVVDAASLADDARRIGHTGNPAVDLVDLRRARAGRLDLPPRFTLDRPRAIEFLSDLKELVDLAPTDATLDLERHAVAPERTGRLLQIHEALSRLDALARSGAEGSADARTLPTLAVEARVKRGDLADIDISTVLATWETRYSTHAIDSDRTYNLKVGASKLNGHILKPQEVFSFNQVLGDRTEKEGYRVAPVISGGELIDGLAGGMCQIASTLHAASFFAGIDIVSSTPHSRPSAYIPLGLDSTVVYPTTDLKLRNPYDFPVVMHYQVNQGAVKVELLGKARPYKVVFEREILEEHPFGTSGRSDHDAPAGQRYVAQEGYPGYKAIRRRYLFEQATSLPRFLGTPEEPLADLLKKKKIAPFRVEKWQIHYPATEQITVVGSGPSTLPKKEPPPSHRIPPVPKDAKPFGRIVR